MNVGGVLEATLSPDNQTRQNAEQQLKQAEEADFAQYLSVLSDELGKDGASSTVRMAAGLALKNSLTSKEQPKQSRLRSKWLQGVNPDVRKQVKEVALETLGAKDRQAAAQAAQLVAAIATIEIPQNEWPELMPQLVHKVGTGPDNLKISSLITIGFITESEDQDLRRSLFVLSSAILTAVVQGARKDEPNDDVRLAAMQALAESLDFVEQNMEDEGERNFILQVVCEATQAENDSIKQSAFGCLNKIVGLYYRHMPFYMEKALYGLTIEGMKNEDEDVAKLAVEFWCTVCEEEWGLLEASRARSDGDPVRVNYNFAKTVVSQAVPTLLNALTKQEDYDDDDDYNIAKAAYACLGLYALAVEDQIIPPVLEFVERNLRNEDWHHREAAVAAFGAILDGPDADTLISLVKQALPVLIGMMVDQSTNVQESVAFALSRICEYTPQAIEFDTMLPQLIQALLEGLKGTPKTAQSSCWGWMQVHGCIPVDLDPSKNPLVVHFEAIAQQLFAAADRDDADVGLRAAAYEALGTQIINCPPNIELLTGLTGHIIQRLEESISMRSQVLNVEDNLSVEEMQNSLIGVLMAITTVLEADVKSLSDRIMTVLLQVLNSVPTKSTVPETVFGAIGSQANALEGNFQAYMEAFKPFLFNALGNEEDPSLCSMAVGLVGDIVRALGDKAQPYCDNFMNYLMNALQGSALGNTFRPAILQTFGDIAQAIGGHYETYLAVASQVLKQAAASTLDLERGSAGYLISLREGIMDAWDGAILAMKHSGKADLLRPYVNDIFEFVLLIADPSQRQLMEENLAKSTMGVIGDLADAFPNRELAQFFKDPRFKPFIKMVRSGNGPGANSGPGSSYDSRTTDTATWAWAQVNQQLKSGG